MVQWDSVEQLEQYQLHQRNDLPKLGTDSKLLAQFATLHRREKVLDLGCGVGVLGVLLAQRQKELTLDGIDIVPESAELAAYNLTANGLTGTIRQGDLNHCRQWAPRPGGYDLVISNPPYFQPGHGGDGGGARQADCSLEELCRTAARLLRNRGRFALCHRPERLAEVLDVLRAHRLEPKRLAFVKNRADAAPWLFLVEAQKNRKTGLRVEPDVLISAGAALYGR